MDRFQELLTRVHIHFLPLDEDRVPLLPGAGRRLHSQIPIFTTADIYAVDFTLAPERHQHEQRFTERSAEFSELGDLPASALPPLPASVTASPSSSVPPHVNPPAMNTASISTTIPHPISPSEPVHASTPIRESPYAPTRSRGTSVVDRTFDNEGESSNTNLGSLSQRPSVQPDHSLASASPRSNRPRGPRSIMTGSSHGSHRGDLSPLIWPARSVYAQSVMSAHSPSHYPPPLPPVFNTAQEATTGDMGDLTFEHVHPEGTTPGLANKGTLPGSATHLDLLSPASNSNGPDNAPVIIQGLRASGNSIHEVVAKIVNSTHEIYLGPVEKDSVTEGLQRQATSPVDSGSVVNLSPVPEADDSPIVVRSTSPSLASVASGLFVAAPSSYAAAISKRNSPQPDKPALPDIGSLASDEAAALTTVSVRHEPVEVEGELSARPASPSGSHKQSSSERRLSGAMDPTFSLAVPPTSPPSSPQSIVQSQHAREHSPASLRSLGAADKHPADRDDSVVMPPPSRPLSRAISLKLKTDAESSRAASRNSSHPASERITGLVDNKRADEIAYFVCRTFAVACEKYDHKQAMQTSAACAAAPNITNMFSIARTMAPFTCTHENVKETLGHIVFGREVKNPKSFNIISKVIAQDFERDWFSPAYLTATRDHPRVTVLPWQQATASQADVVHPFDSGTAGETSSGAAHVASTVTNVESMPLRSLQVSVENEQNPPPQLMEDERAPQDVHDTNLVASVSDSQLGTALRTAASDEVHFVDKAKVRYFVRVGAPFEVPPQLKNFTASGAPHTAIHGDLFFVKRNQGDRLDESLLWIFMNIALSLEPAVEQWVHVQSFRRDYSVQHIHPISGLCLNFTVKKGEPTWIKTQTFEAYRAAYERKEERDESDKDHEGH